MDKQYQQDKRHTIANVHQSSNTSVGNVGKCSIFLQEQTYQEAITPVVKSCWYCVDSYKEKRPNK